MTSWSHMHVCWLVLCASGAAATETTETTEATEEAGLDEAFLEFLGSWDAGDDQWVGAAIAAAEQEVPPAQPDPETTELDEDEY